MSSRATVLVLQAESDFVFCGFAGLRSLALGAEVARLLINLQGVLLLGKAVCADWCATSDRSLPQESPGRFSLHHDMSKI